MAQKSLFRTPAVTAIADNEDEMPLYLNVPRSGYVCCTNFPVLQYLEVALELCFVFFVINVKYADVNSVANF